MNLNSIIEGNWKTRVVTIDGKVLSPAKSQKVWNHSPDGYSWNYAGSGPSQLSLALLLEITTKEEALKYYQDFKFDKIATLPPDDFRMTGEEVYEWLLRKRNNEERAITGSS